MTKLATLLFFTFSLTMIQMSKATNSFDDSNIDEQGKDALEKLTKR